MRISDWSSDVCSSDLFYVRCHNRGVNDSAPLPTPPDDLAIARALARFPPDVLSDEALREKLARVAFASDFAIAVLARQPDLLARLAAAVGAAPPTELLLDAGNQNGRAYVWTPVTNAALVC